MQCGLKQNLKEKYNDLFTEDNSFNNTLNETDKKELETMKLICDQKQALGILSATYFVVNSKIYKVYFTRTYLLIQNKMICMNIMCENTGEDSKTWIIEKTNSWVKEIIEANK